MKRELVDEIINLEIRPKLEPFCKRFEPSGGYRRRKKECHDIEIVCIPKQTPPIDLFGNETQPVQGFIDAVNSWPKIIGEPTGKNTRRTLPYDNAMLDLFIVRPENFGYILAIRTGSQRFAHEVLAKGWVLKGYNGAGGMLVHRSDGQPIPIREERELFKLIGVEWREPWERE